MEIFLLAHKAMRRDFVALGGLVRATQPEDRRLLGAISSLLEIIRNTVRMHHEGEDRVVCPALTRKAPSFAPHQAKLREQHLGLVTALREARQLMDGLQAAQGPEFASARDRLASRLDWMRDYVDQHLGYEDREMTPCALACLTYQELRSVGRIAMGKNRKRDLLAALPWVLSAATVEERHAFMNGVPLVARILYRFWWKPRYDRMVRPLLLA